MNHRNSRRRATALTAATVLTCAALAVVQNTGTPARAAATNDPTCGTAVNGTPVSGSGQSPTDYALNVGGPSSFGTVWDPPGNTQAAFPTVFGTDTVGSDGTPLRRFTTKFSVVADNPTAAPKSGQVQSTDNGSTFPASTYTDAAKKAPPSTGTARLRDGTLLAYAFKPTDTSGSSSSIASYRSTDDGATWSEDTATFKLGATATGEPRTTGTPLELPDGTILVLLYGAFSGVSGNRTQVEASTDGGHTFVRRGVLVNGNGTDNYSEAAVAPLPGGKLLSVVRHDVGGVPRTAVTSTSADGGATWATPQPLSVSFPNGYDPFDDSTKPPSVVSPDLKLMPNGVMVLRSGRTDNWVAISTNGLGTGWIGQLTYRNCPTDGYRLHGSTGYGGIDYLSANRAIVVGDNCDLTWSCVTASETHFTVDKQARVWRRFIDVLTPDTGKIDLASKYRKGTVTVTGNMTSAVPGHPRARVDGAFDGSTEYWSSAVHAGGAGTFILNLDRTYSLTQVGLSLRNGRVATGRVYTSTDGVNWGEPVVTAVDRTHLAMEYVRFAEPISARYVKVEVDPSTDCEEGLGASCAFLNEVELYSTVDSFENDPVNAIPRGFTEVKGGWVTRASDLDGNDSESALRIVDSYTNAMAKAVWNGPSSASKTLEFRFKPVTLKGFLFDVLGRTSSGASVTAYHFAVGANGSIGRYDGARWVTVAPAGTVTEGRWSTIRVAAGISTASISLNGGTVASAMPAWNPAASLYGYAFASNGTASTGDNYLIDDILFSP